MNDHDRYVELSEAYDKLEWDYKMLQAELARWKSYYREEFGNQKLLEIEALEEERRHSEDAATHS